MENKYTTVDAYIASFPGKTGQLLQAIRQTILDNAPAVTEAISYGMPAYKVNGKPIAYFAAFARHIGFYAAPNAHRQFATELSGYKQGKGSVQFPHDQPVPLDLIARMVRFNVAGAISKSKE